MQDKIQEITRRHNRLLNILLALYVILCLIFALLMNGFFVKPKAFTNDFSWEITGTCINNGGYGTNTRTVRYTSNGRTKAIFYTDPNFIELLNDVISANNQTEITATCVMIRARDRDLGGTITETEISSEGGSVPALRNNSLFLDRGTTLYNYFTDLGYELPPISGRSYIVSYMVNGTVDNSPDNIYTAEFASDVEFVDNAKDLKSYLVDGDDSVINVSNPDNPPIVEDSSIPTPQKVKIINDGKCPTIAWENPKRALQFGDKLKVKIDFKPTFTLWMGLSPISEDLVCNEWIVAFEDFLNNHNAFSIKQNSASQIPNDLNAYNYIVDDQYIFDTSPVEDYAKSYIKYVIDQNGNTSLVPYGVGNPPTSATKMQKKLNAKSGVVGGELADSLWDTLAPEALATIKGLFDGGQTRNCQFRIRYEVQDGSKILVSPWVNATKQFDVNGNSTSDTDITFSDKDDTPIQNPTYLPASSTNVTPVSSDAWWMNFNGYTGTMFENLTQQMSDWTGDTGGFVGFFGELFNEFPFLSWCLLFSLSLAIFLRIFGR